MMDHTMPDISLVMLREDLKGIPDFPLPRGYGVRLYRSGDRENWARIETSAGEFNRAEEAAAFFDEYFGPHEDELRRRIHFLTDDAGRAIGTATAWRDDKVILGAPDEKLGRLHWVAIEEAHQGKGLSKPLVGCVLRKLAELGYERAYLTTQPPSYVAIKVYAAYGFAPHCTGRDDEARGWECVRERIDWP